jgi:hypothetical protein
VGDTLVSLDELGIGALRVWQHAVTCAVSLTVDVPVPDNVGLLWGYYAGIPDNVVFDVSIGFRLATRKKSQYE